jgi:hypothetical protein
MEIIGALVGPHEGHKTALQLSFRALSPLAFGAPRLRITGRRTFARASPLDILAALIPGSNLSRMMGGDAPSTPPIAATLEGGGKVSTGPEGR